MDKQRNAPPHNKKMVWAVSAVALFSIITIAYLYIDKQSAVLHRPQEPQGPFSYSSVEVSFQNRSANITLSGTLTIPSITEQTERSPVVILISGSGPQNRDAEWYGHKPFLIIADELTKLGIAVLRYDDRGFGKSTGDYNSGTSLDFSTDVESAIRFLKTRKEIDTTKIGLIGHSDGAMIAPIVAARMREVCFLVLLAAPGKLGREVMLERQELLERKAGKSEDDIRQTKLFMEKLIGIIVNAKDEKNLTMDLTQFANENKDLIPNDQLPPGMTKDEFISRQVSMLKSPWFRYFFTYNPESDLKKVKCPVLALTGDRDVQAPSAENLPAIQNALVSGGNKDVSVKELKGLNHMFQECSTGLIDEYSKIDQTFSPIALKEISQFVSSKTHVTKNVQKEN